MKRELLGIVFILIFAILKTNIAQEVKYISNIEKVENFSLKEIHDFAVDENGNFFFPLFEQNIAIVVSKTGEIIKEYKDSGNDEIIISPISIAKTEDDDIFILNSNNTVVCFNRNGKVQKYDKNGS